jgi:hypothetical protein
MMLKKISLLAIFACALALMLTVFSPGAALGANASDSTQVLVPREQPVEVAFAVDLTGFVRAGTEPRECRPDGGGRASGGARLPDPGQHR